MSWTLTPLTERVQRLRADYRDTLPEICIARYRILTAFYMQNPALTGILRRAKAMREIFEKLPIRIGSDEVIVDVYKRQLFSEHHGSLSHFCRTQALS